MRYSFTIVLLVAVMLITNAEKISLAAPWSEYYTESLMKDGTKEYFYIELAQGEAVIDNDLNIIVPPQKETASETIMIYKPSKYKIIEVEYNQVKFVNNIRTAVDSNESTIALWNLDGDCIIAKGRYYSAEELDNTYIRVRKSFDKKLYGLCNYNGEEILEPLYADVKIEKGLPYVKKYIGSSWQSAKLMKSGNRDNNQGSTKASSKSNVIDNSAKIAEVKRKIAKLKSKKKECYKCKGTQLADAGPCIFCKGTGTVKVGYYTPQFYPCSRCNQSGRSKVSCDLCIQTDRSISLSQTYLQTLKDTHGLTKEDAEFYYQHKAALSRIENEYQRNINNMVNSRLQQTYSSGSSSSIICGICRGTGIDPAVWDSESASRASVAGGFTNSLGTKCPHCGLYTWHQHKYCAKCNANKYR